MLRHCLTTILIILFSKGSFAQRQTLQVDLARKTGEGPFKTGIMPTFISDQKYTLPPVKTAAHLVKYHKLRYAGTDDSIQNIHLNFFIGTINDSIVVIADTNFNQDFTDDRILHYPSSKNQIAALPYIQVTIPGTDIRITLQPYPYKTAFTYHSEEEQSLYLMVKGYEHFEGMNLSGIQLFIANRRPDISFTTEEDILVAIKNSSGTALKRWVNLFNLITTLTFFLLSTNHLENLFLQNWPKPINQEALQPDFGSHHSAPPLLPGKR